MDCSLAESRYGLPIECQQELMHKKPTTLSHICSKLKKYIMFSYATSFIPPCDNAKMQFSQALQLK